MNYVVTIVFLLVMAFSSHEIKAQAIVLPCVPSGNSCIPVSASNPLPTTPAPLVGALTGCSSGDVLYSSGNPEVVTCSTGGLNIAADGGVSIGNTTSLGAGTLNVNGAGAFGGALSSVGYTSSVATGTAFQANVTSSAGNYVIKGQSGNGVGASVGMFSDSTNGAIGTENNFALGFFVNNGAYRMQIGTTGGVFIGTPTGTDKGAGTLNVQGAYYANGTIGVSATKTVRASGGLSDCTLIFTGGILTGGSC